MHDQRSPRGSSPRNSSLAPAEQDARAQQTLLGLVLLEHPAQLSVSELVLALSEDPEDFGQRDLVQRAVRDLASVGLLHHQGGAVRPTRAALRFQELELDGLDEEQI
jgi:hypothetical protein